MPPKFIIEGQGEAQKSTFRKKTDSTKRNIPVKEEIGTNKRIKVSVDVVSEELELEMKREDGPNEQLENEKESPEDNLETEKKRDRTRCR